MPDISGPVTLALPPGVYKSSPFNPNKPHIANHARQPGIVDHRTAKKARVEMVNNSVGCFIPIRLWQLLRQYFRISLRAQQKSVPSVASGSAAEPPHPSGGQRSPGRVPPSKSSHTSISGVNTPRYESHPMLRVVATHASLQLQLCSCTCNNSGEPLQSYTPCRHASLQQHIHS